MRADTEPRRKPLGRKAYGSIGHLPMSRMGPADHAIHPGQARICTEKTRDRHDRVIVQEKLDGSCVAVALIDGVLHPLGRAGWPAASSPYEQHHLFDQWVRMNEDRFLRVLREGERIVGEWLAQAHGTRYDLAGLEPFAAFDIMRGKERMPFDELWGRIDCIFFAPPMIKACPLAMSVADALDYIEENGQYGATEPIEGVVYRVERKGKVDFLAKYVRPDKVDGCYLPEVSGMNAVWNWRP